MTDNRTTAVLMDGYRIIVDTGDDPLIGSQMHGYFATEEEAMDYAMLHRSRLGLNRCVSWHVEHSGGATFIARSDRSLME